ncbi:MAG: PucR family transcriptional regulator [Clostridiales bacterium]|nr:PucR family transcriptional regulator [Clostridiales bacterium]
MKLSMWILLDELSDFSPKSAIQNGLMSIEGFRLFVYEETIQNDFVYIGYAHEFFGDDSHQIILVHQCDIIIIGQAELAEIINRMIVVFDKYHRWNEKLIKARHEQNPYQAILDAAHDMLRCPMFFGNKNLHIYAITRQYSKDQLYEEWDDVKALNTMPVRFLEKLKKMNMTKEYPNEVDPAVMPAWPDTGFKYHIRSNCYINKAIWGHFYIYWFKQDVSPAIPQLTRHVADVYGQLLQETQGINSDKYAVYSRLVELLDGHNITADAIRPIYWSLKWEETDTLVLYKVSTTAVGYDRTLLYWLCDSFSEISAIAIMFPYNDSIIIIARDISKHTQAVRECISHHISVSDYHYGVSFSFMGLQNIVTFYKQAGYAIKHAPDLGGKCHAYKDCPLEGLASEMKSHLRWQDWVPPSLFRLIETDAAQGTEYYTTLYQLLVHKWHLGNAAKALYIHRNTLLYRLEKLERLLAVDIHSQSVQAYLRFCFLMMMEAYPIGALPPPKAPDN